MKSAPLSRWNHTQLAFLRLLTTTLGMVDRLLNIRWGEHLLARMANRWQAQLEQINKRLAQLEDERYHLQSQIEALSIQVATLYLGGRSLTRNELRFDPAVPHDNDLLDASIDLLVKQRLATIESEEIEPGHFVYHLDPAWDAIHKRLRTAADQAEPDTAEWLREGIRFIEESLLPGNGNQIEQQPSNPNQE
ncbi:MAG TPA: hypothetical protein VLY63_15360 [Anaerolineae bacterium]|nr:hypothetical protein [Anaerolineae bacterium]